jgi:hypothetical protein
MEDANVANLSVERYPNGRLKRLRGEVSLPHAESLDAAVRAFLEARHVEHHPAALAAPAGSRTIELRQEAQTPIGTILRYQTCLNGIPVHQAWTVVHVDPNKRLRQVEYSHPADLSAPTDAGTKLSPEQAYDAALKSLGQVQLRKSANREARKVYFDAGKGASQPALTLSYLVEIPTQLPMHDWQIIIDADTGAILSKEDVIKHAADGSGLVFDPNPVTTKMDNSIRQPTATAAGGCAYNGSALSVIDAQRVTRTLRDLTLSGGVYTLEGPYVKITQITDPTSTIPTEANPNNFNYSSSDERFGAVTLYYHIDTIQRYLQSIGITTANNRQTSADPAVSDLGYSAYYSPIDKSLHMGISRPCHPDKSQDGKASIHEYGHAIQDNQVPGWGGTNPGTGRNETGAMGEGFGDSLACIFFANFSNGFQRETFEDWPYVENGANGLRRVDGTKVYPTSWVGEVHADGEIWSAALWNIYRTVGGDSMNPADKLAARDAVLKSVVLSHHLLATNATMPSGAEAVMTTHAALDDYRGRYLTQMLDSFHNRGLLLCDAKADLFIRDDPGDTGAEPFVGPVFWESPDLWVRNADDGGTTHQDPKFGQDNYFYARVTNRGTVAARAFVVSFNVKPWAGVQFLYPGDFTPCISANVGFNLAPGVSTILQAKWPAALIPPTGTHVCLLGQVYTPTDTSPAGSHVWDKNNLAQKNITIAAAGPGDMAKIRFQIGNLRQHETTLYNLELLRPVNLAAIAVTITAGNSEATRALFTSADHFQPPHDGAAAAVPSRITFRDHATVEMAVGGAASPVKINFAPGSSLDLGDSERAAAPEPAKFPKQAKMISTPAGAAIEFFPGKLVGFPVALRGGTQSTCEMQIAVPRNAKPKEVLKFHVVQRNTGGKVVGGISVEVHVSE